MSDMDHPYLSLFLFSDVTVTDAIFGVTGNKALEDLTQSNQEWH